jgi:hypothetical protein
VHREQSHFIRLTVQEYGYTCIFAICGIGELRFSSEQGEHGSAESAKICEQKRPVESATGRIGKRQNHFMNLSLNREGLEECKPNQKKARCILSNFSFSVVGVVPPKRQDDHLLPKQEKMSGWRDSNTRPPGPKPGTLPTALHPEIFF